MSNLLNSPDLNPMCPKCHKWCGFGTSEECPHDFILIGPGIKNNEDFELNETVPKIDVKSSGGQLQKMNDPYKKSQ